MVVGWFDFVPCWFRTERDCWLELSCVVRFGVELEMEDAGDSDLGLIIVECDDEGDSDDAWDLSKNDWVGKSILEEEANSERGEMGFEGSLRKERSLYNFSPANFSPVKFSKSLLH